MYSIRTHPGFFQGLDDRERASTEPFLSTTWLSGPISTSSPAMCPNPTAHHLQAFTPAVLASTWLGRCLREASRGIGCAGGQRRKHRGRVQWVTPESLSFGISPSGCNPAALQDINKSQSVLYQILSCPHFNSASPTSPF